MKTVDVLTTMVVISILLALTGCSAPANPTPEETAAISEPVAEQPESAAN